MSDLFFDCLGDTRALTPEFDAETASRLQADANNRTVAVQDNLPKVNVDRHNYGTGKAFVTHFPNGLRVIREGSSYKFEAPPGGAVSADGKTVYDSQKKVVARADDNDAVQVDSKYGKFLEKKDGKVDFTANAKTPVDNNLQSLHKKGDISKSQYEDYGLATDGKSTTFPNGLKWTKGTAKDSLGDVTYPAEYDQPYEVDSQDADGNPVRTAYVRKGGQLIYRMDSQGVHVPVADGVVTQKADGTVTFEPKAP